MNAGRRWRIGRHLTAKFSPFHGGALTASGTDSARKAGDRRADDGTTLRSAPPTASSPRSSQKPGSPTRGSPAGSTSSVSSTAWTCATTRPRSPGGCAASSRAAPPRADRRGVHPPARPPALRPGPRPRRVCAGLRGPGVRRDARGGRRHRQRPVAQGLRQPRRTPQDRLHPGGPCGPQPGLADRPRRRPGGARGGGPAGQRDRASRPRAAPPCPASATRPTGGARPAGDHAATSRRSARSANCSAPSTTPTAAATPARPWCATWSTRPSRCCAAPTARDAGRRLFARRRRPDAARRLDLVRHRRARARPALLRAGAAAVAGRGGPGVRLVRAGHHEPPGRLPRARPGGGATGAGRPAGRGPAGAARRAGAAARGRGARARGARRGAGLHRLARPGRAGPGGGPARATTCRTGRASSTRRSSPTSSATATATSSSTARPPSTPSARCSCAPPATPAPGCSAGSCSPRPGSGLGELDQACALGAEAAQQASRDAVGPRGRVRTRLRAPPGAVPGRGRGARLPGAGGRVG